MFNKILNFFTDFFTRDSYGQRLESYLVSKGVQSASDVEYWMRNYEKQSFQGFR